MELVALIGTVVFAASGVLAVIEQRLDWFGAIVVGVVTASGGGTLRDLILGISPPFWVTDQAYLLAAFGGAVAGIAVAYALRWTEGRLDLALRVADAVGLAVFSYVGAELTLANGYEGSIAIVMAVLTGVGGGLMRDVLTARTPLVLTGEIYAVAAIAGAAMYVALVELSALPDSAAAAIAMSTTLSIRVMSLHREWSLPVAGS